MTACFKFCLHVTYPYTSGRKFRPKFAISKSTQHIHHTSSTSPQNTMHSRSMLLQLILSLSLFQFASAFSTNLGQPTSGKVQSRSTNPLHSASLDENDARPNWIDLPSTPKAQDNIEKYDGIEIGIGRVAMVGFVGMFANEVVSGESFGQQIVDALMVASGTQ